MCVPQPLVETIEEHNIPTSCIAAKVLSVRHWSDDLFSFAIERPASFRFRSGEFVMIGLIINGKSLLRAYSVASPSWNDQLEFYSIKVQDGPLTSHLQKIQVGDKILLGRKPTGTLVLDAITPAKRLYMFSTGTGIAPFASFIRDPDVYKCFDDVILTHTCRSEAELRYGQALVADIENDPLVSEVAKNKLRYVSSLTREGHPLTGRITDLLSRGTLFEYLSLPPMTPEQDRVMICGSMDMLKDTKTIVEGFGLTEGSNAAPGDFVIERAFVG